MKWRCVNRLLRLCLAGQCKTLLCLRLGQESVSKSAYMLVYERTVPLACESDISSSAVTQATPAPSPTSAAPMILATEQVCVVEIMLELVCVCPLSVYPLQGLPQTPASVATAVFDDNMSFLHHSNMFESSLSDFVVSFCSGLVPAVTSLPEPAAGESQLPCFPYHCV